MKIYTTQVIKEQILNDDFKVVLAPIKNFSKDGHVYLDITATAGSPFAPSWDLLRAFKAGEVSKHEYTDEYHALMSKDCKENRKAWEWLQSRKSIVLACYCNPGSFCHRYIFADILEKCFIAERLGELPQNNVKDWIEALRTPPTEANEAEQLREYTNLFLKHPDNDKPLKTKKKYSPFNKKPFLSDNWIFQGTNNDPEPAIADDFLTIEGLDVWTGTPEIQASREIAKKLENTVPLKYGEIGAQAIDDKFKNKQLDTIIFQDCKPTPDGIKIMQLTAAHEVMIPSYLQLDKIATYANISHRHAAFVSKCYQELGFSFQDVQKTNKAIRNRKAAHPWDIEIYKGKSLLGLVFDLKHIDILTELKAASDPQYDDWCHYDAGIGETASKRVVDLPGTGEETRITDHTDLYQFKIMDDLAASAPAGLSEIQFVPFDDTKTNYQESDLDSYTGNNKVNLFTYWNVSKIRTPNELKGAKTARTFKKMRNAILDNDLSVTALKKFKKITRKFTPAQRKEIRAAMRVKA